MYATYQQFMLELLSDLIEITQMFRHNVLRYGLILAIDHVHVQLAFAALDQRAQFERVHQTALQRFQEQTEGGNDSSVAANWCPPCIRYQPNTYSRCHS